MKHSILKTNKSKLIAAANDSIKLGEFGSEINMQFVQDRKTTSILQSLRRNAVKTPFRLSLRLEKIRGNYAFPIIDVVLNEKNPAPESIRKTLGKLALYGLENSSVASIGVSGNGLNERMDVTEMFIRSYQQANWSDDDFSIKLIPQFEVEDHAELSIESVELWYEEDFVEIGS